MPVPILRRQRSQKLKANSQAVARRAHQRAPIVEAVEERLLLSGGTANAYVGVAFQPYVKQWSATKISGRFEVPSWNSYESGDASVMNQLEIVAKNFQSVATYSSGWYHWTPPVPFKDLNSNVLVATDAGTINKGANALRLTFS
jgi:hypothetical protein